MYIHTSDYCPPPAASEPTLHTAQKTTSDLCCPHCQKRFNRRYNLARHLKAFSGSRMCDRPEKMCLFCGKNFPTKANLKMHIQNGDNECPVANTDQCPRCHDVFKSKSVLRKHVQSCFPENIEYRCPRCQRKFMKKYNLERHLRSFSGDTKCSAKDYSCPHCHASFSKRFNQQRHIATCSENRNRMKTKEELQSENEGLCCPSCKKCFPRALNFVVHVVIYCELPSSTDKKAVEQWQSGLYQPNNTCNSSQGRPKSRRSYQCPHCHNYFASQFNLKRHASRHTGNELTHCPHCVASFERQADFLTHLVVHMRTDRSLECPLCQESFELPSELFTHLCSHSEVVQ